MPFRKKSFIFSAEKSHHAHLFMSAHYHLLIVVYALIWVACQSSPAEEHSTDRPQADTLVLSVEEQDSILGSSGEQGRNSWQKPFIVLDFLGNINGKTVADIGAGSGYFTIRLPSRGAKVLALDIDGQALRTIDEVIHSTNYPADFRKNIEMRLVPENDPQLAENEVDAVLIINTIAYLPQRLKYLKKLHQAIKPDGQILIVDFKMNRIPLDVPRAERLPAYIVEEELAKAGFTNILVDECQLDYQYMVKATCKKAE